MATAEPLGAGFLAECRALDAFVGALPARVLPERTHFHGWTVRDEIMHLLFLDEVTRTAIEDEDGFLARLRELRAWQATGAELSDYMRGRYADLDDAALIVCWRDGYAGLAAVFAGGDPRARMKWFGPDMSLRSAASARQMEVWAHGQDVYDHLGVERINADRVRDICDLGARTFGWSFANRGRPAPPRPPRIALTAPSGKGWTWHPDGDGLVAGAAEDFALVVTRRRHVDDTDLIVEGEAARAWMPIAQCFAGAAADGPAAGLGRVFGRGWRRGG